MLTSIKKIKNLGVFGDYSAPAGLKDFTRFNLIYGENGAGKTTLSRLFTALNDGGHTDYPNLQYKVSAEGGTLSQGDKCKRKLRIFNSDYVEANIGRFDEPIRHILIVGAGNKILAEEVRREQAVYDARSVALKNSEANLAKLEADRGKVFSAVAKTIGEATSGATLRGYRKQNAERDFEIHQPLRAYDEAELEVYRATLRQEQADPLPAFHLPAVSIGDGEPVPFETACQRIEQSVSRVTSKTAQEGALKRLSENPDIAKWVEDGLNIHRKHGSQRCEFCEQPLPKVRFEAIADHFSEADQLLKLEIEGVQTLVTCVTKSLASLMPPQKHGLYSELWDEFDTACSQYEAARTTCFENLEKIDRILEAKLANRSSSTPSDQQVDAALLVAATDAVKKTIERHNLKTSKFDAEKSLARTKIERHYLFGISDQVADFDRQMEAEATSSKKLQNGDPDLEEPRGMEALLASIKEKRAKVMNAHAGGEQMTKRLTEFLGRTDLAFESQDEGYRVLRRGKPAKRLSEGEKTAIAFLYFVVQLGDHEFAIEEGIVVIDDPISSLDSSAIYQAFACLKHAVKDAKQVFLMTHNFDFMRLLLDWLKHEDGTPRYYMIICSEGSDERSARIAPLDKMLTDHATEYHYLFKTLHSFKSNGEIGNCYHIPNVARKVLETFLDFYAPAEKSMHAQMRAIKFDEQKKTAILKFTNDQSHRTGKGFDPAIVGESQKTVAYLLEMIKDVAPLHFDGLEKMVA